VFIIVNIDSLKALSKPIELRLSKIVKIKRDITNTIIVRKYLFISLKLKLISVNNNLFIKIFLGLLKDKIWLIEYLNNE
tara:strand:+ start:259 stop:495 length:237 start_codon:yes stop_codon:yes gene_type:complete